MTCRATVADNNPDVSHRTCGRIEDEALQFIATAARFPERSVVPSGVVDEGRHALIPHTRAYRDLGAKPEGLRPWSGPLPGTPSLSKR
ncbi:hypothetical protein ACSNOK_04510 [Streptomyces sp. URMC 126]|uniref:hypothetical protein n=1 Tax=Streptomyces sp. URMC 126 TaxID=3423401 RepID=UPI003F1B3D21